MGKKLFLSLIVGVLLVVVGVLVLGAESSNNISQNNSEDLIVFNDKGTEEKDITITPPVAINEFKAIPRSQVERKQVKYFQNNDISSVNLMTNKTNIVKKPIFDTTWYLNKNISNDIFFKPMTILYQGKLLSGKGHTEIDIDFLKNVAKNLPKSSIPYILDIELWNVHMDDDMEANKNIDKYILVIDTMKKARPDLKFGYYGVLPNSNYFAPVNRASQELDKWLHVNKRLKRLASHVDVVCPSVYTFGPDIDKWKVFAIANIQEAKKYGKPVYPFIWPQFHECNLKLKWTYIGNEYVYEELSLVSREADGVIMWGGWDLTNDRAMQWDENAPWWQMTKKFISDQNR